MHFDTATVSQRHGRSTNQDYLDYLQNNQGGCWVVADGLGGHHGGATAARLAVTEIVASYTRNPEVFPETLSRHLWAAQQAILAEQRQNSALEDMRTTVVVLVADRRAAMWGHVGDSRLYLFKEGHLLDHTRDHSVAQTLVSTGDLRPQELRGHEDRHRLLRSLGQPDDLRPTLAPKPHELAPGDVFLLCTDGFWEYVTETEMEVDLAKSTSPGRWLARMETRLLEKARANPEKRHDNYSAIAVFY
jgi:serine/threonine protein phosphatase PrpC